ncbi:selenium cofactor biosynthesis protein YqeC [Vagococcus acidifermentans]|uniref:Selenium-dependent hydroxylase accessory protein YqeC n=1 Tax=Vagococcus acidifermentans TaxID=564710 RepID=A0A430AVP0_9ENTE|nr:selenium cofactor biosynthesis protein YqeC [Vagococcus acidifermentans]RSU12130.1 hypothetical protein CBF27_06800 [Vagococcus acidifermentans]
MRPLVDCFQLKKREIISLVGSGGKTTLLWHLAGRLSDEALLITTTTHIGYPFPPFRDISFYPGSVSKEQVASGITVVGKVLPGKSKITSLPLSQLREIVPLFQKVVMECDGSKTLPLKAWKSYEPVIIPETTMTVGILPLTVIGRPVSEGTVHRLALFAKDFEVSLGDPISAELLARIATHDNGLFREGAGQRILFLNQADVNENALQQAVRIAELSSKKRAGIDKIIAGSAQKGQGVILWEKNESTPVSL